MCGGYILRNGRGFPFLTAFQGIVVSGKLGILKPDPRIYEALASTFGVDLKQSVFIDDSEKNVMGARAVGMQAIRFTSPKALERDLKSLGLG